MGKVQKQFTISNNASFEDKPPLNLAAEIVPSNAESIFNQLVDAIARDDDADFSNALSSDFIYPGDGLKEGDTDFSSGSFNPLEYLSSDVTDLTRHNQMTSDNHYSSTYIGDHHTRHFVFRYYWVRPIIENLFFEHNELFRRLMSQLALSENTLIHNSFVENFNRTDVSPEILLPWNANIATEVRLRVTEITMYGEQLISEGVDRGNYATKLAGELDERLNTLPVVDDSNTAKIKWLDFKLKFVEHLHSQDSHFVGHRGWKKVIGNVASIIFSAGILNLINLAVTGNFFFFNKTRTQQLVTEVDHSINKPDRMVLSY